MNFRSHLLSGLTIFVSMAGAYGAATPPSDIPPGPQQVPSSSSVTPATPAPPQANAKSAPGAASPNGSNGTAANGNPVTKAPNTPAAASPTTTAAPPPTEQTNTVLDGYLKDLDDALKLSADEKKDIQTYYLADGAQLQSILNDPSLSPLQQDVQVCDLRDKRNAKIEALLQDVDRQRDFFKVEAQYRVALTESAATGGLLPQQTPPPAPTPQSATPGGAEPVPNAVNGKNQPTT